MTGPEHHDLDPSPAEVVTSCKQFTDFNHFYLDAKNAINSAKSHMELVYTEVKADWGPRIVDKLNDHLDGNYTRKSYNPGTNVLWVRIMPTRVHNCHVQWYISSEYRWVANNIITEQEMELLWKSSSDSMTRIPTADIQTSYLTFPAVEFEGPYAGARKEPDWMVTPNTFDLPSFVIEAGWTESWDRLMDDMNLWLVGGQGKVSTVVILKWERIGQSTRVRGVAELYSLDADGMSVRRQSETIFPAPAASGQQYIRLTRRALFGAALPSGRNGNDVLPMSLNKLRDVAAQALSLMGFIPA